MPSGELDADLLAYLDSLIARQLARAAGPTYDAADPTEEDKLGAAERTSVEVLRMLKRRLEVEAKQTPDVRLLGKLLGLPSTKAREEMLTRNVVSVEQLERFADFVQSGVAFTVEAAAKPREGEEGERPRSGNLQELRDVLALTHKVLSKLTTGLSDSTDIFSTNAEDYIDKQRDDDEDSRSAAD